MQAFAKIVSLGDRVDQSSMGASASEKVLCLTWVEIDGLNNIDSDVAPVRIDFNDQAVPTELRSFFWLQGLVHQSLSAIQSQNFEASNSPCELPSLSEIETLYSSIAEKSNFEVKLPVKTSVSSSSSSASVVSSPSP